MSGDYRDFVDALQKAEVDSEAESVKTVVEAGKRNWKAAMTYLEPGTLTAGVGA